VLKLPCLTILATAFAVTYLPAQTVDAPVKMTPEFPLVFPLLKKGDDVTVKFPVMINPTTVLKPGMILRTLYMLQQGTDSTDLSLVHATDQDEAYARTNPSADGQQKMPYELAHQLEGYRRTVWSTPTNFQLAMAQFPTESMHLIYALNGMDRKLLDQRFSFFDGMLIGQPDGSSVVVLAVENDSKAANAGIKAGDEIVAVGGEPTQHDLTTFATVFAEVRKNARDMNAPTYALTIRSPGHSDTHVLNVAMPPTIKSLFMQGF
jgi:hypothetical protein